jgi:hypothetical protein
LVSFYLIPSKNYRYAISIGIPDISRPGERCKILDEAMIFGCFIGYAVVEQHSPAYRWHCREVVAEWAQKPIERMLPSQK